MEKLNPKQQSDSKDKSSHQQALSELFSFYKPSRENRGELQMALGALFHGSSGHIADDTIRYFPPGLNEPWENDKSALVLRFSGNSLKAVEAGPQFEPGLMQELRDVIQRELLGERPRVIGRMLLFSNRPVRGSWRYKDAFQICPTQAVVLRVPKHSDVYPFALEIPFRESDDHLLRGCRLYLQFKRLYLLLAFFLDHGVIWRSTNSDRGYSWVSILDGEGNQSPEISCSPRAFNPTIAGLNSTAFSDASSWPPMPRCFPTVHAPELSLPEDIEKWFAAFLELSEGKQAQFLRACHWFDLSWHLFNHSGSGCYQFMVQALEALVYDDENLWHETPSRHKAKRRGQGATAKFKQFVIKHLPSAKGQEQLLETIYAFRSDIAHGRFLLEHDIYPGWGPSKEETNQQMMLYDIQAATRAAMLNWLMAQGKEGVTHGRQ